MKSQSVAIALLAAALAACGGPTPVGRLAVAPQEIELGYPGCEEVTFSWQFDHALTGLEGASRVFVHLIDDQGGLVRTFDHDLPGGWRVGESRDYPVKLYQSALAPPLAAGVYRITAGLYDAAGHRWALDTAGREVASVEYEVATVSIVDSSDDAPMTIFADAWQPVEGGSDRQVLARRWLSGAGALSLAAIRSAGRVWMGVGIPDGGSRTEDLVLDPDASTPEVRITTTCSGFTAHLSGPGSHSVEVPVERGADGALPESCEIAFETNFYLVSLETLARRTIALENLAWRAE